ncbi:MAG TPA: hypothetical protein VMJ90_10305 [Anaerolineales bacterium]|nr:hypothetical protein [Anaerolineales bacterium]
MEIPWAHIIWLVVAISVYLFGIWEGRRHGYKRRKAEEEKELRENPLATAKPVTVDDPGLLRIRNENGNLTLDLDGTRVDTSALSAEHRKRLVELLTVIRPWLEGRATPAAAPSITSPPPPSSPRPASVQPAVHPPPSTPLSQPVAAKSPVIAIEDRPSTPANSIVAQIDSILQTRITGTSIEERGVFLAQSPDGGVMVYVGLKKYMGVDEVPDEEIKSAIRDAITEWEKKYTPGL